MTLTKKNLLYTSLILMPVTTLSAFLTITLTERQFIKNDLEKVSLLTDIIKNGLVTIMLEGRGKEFHHFLDTLIAEDIEGVHIIGNDGRVISSSPSKTDRKIPDDVFSRLSSRQAAEIAPLRTNERNIYSAIMPIYNERPCQKCHGSKDDLRAILHIEVSRAKISQKIRTNRIQIVGLSVIAFTFLLITFSRLNSKLFIKPISQIRDKIENSGMTSRGGDEEGVSARKQTSPISEHYHDDEISVLRLKINNVLFEMDRLARECREKEIQNKDILSGIEEFKKAIVNNLSNPLSMVIGAMQVLAEELPAQDPKREIIHNIIRDLTIINRSLDITAIFKDKTNSLDS